MNNTLSVSKKVYSDISTRVSTSLINFPASAAEAMRVVDAYLAGDAAVSSTDPMAMIAFNMIKVELDRAMTRSSRARERARVRRESVKSSVSVSPQRPDVAPEELNEPAPVMLSRRERRAMARALSKKTGKKMGADRLIRLYSEKNFILLHRYTNLCDNEEFYILCPYGGRVRTGH